MVAKGKSQQQKPHVDSLFPCASGVTMPLLGAEDAEMHKHLRKTSSNRLVLKPVPVDDTPVDKRYLKKISTDINFEDDVVKERCFHMMPYDTKYLVEALDVSDVVPPRKHSLKPIGRHNARGSDLRHVPCGLKLTKAPSLTPLKKKVARKALAMSMQAQEETSDSNCSASSSQDQVLKQEEKPSDTFMTEVHAEGTVPEESMQEATSEETLNELQRKLKTLKEQAAAEEEEKLRPLSARMKAEKPKKDWDAYLVSQLSELTATWIVHERMPHCRQQEELQKTLESWYGKPTSTDLVQEDNSEEEDFDPHNKNKKVLPKKKWVKKEATLLEKVFSTPAKKGVALDPYSDDNEAPFYRQPAGIRRQKKRVEKEEAADRQDTLLEDGSRAINATAYRIKVHGVKTPKPQTLRDHMPTGLGTTLYESDNQYEQELLAGVPLSHPSEDEVLVMASDHKYKKVLRKDYPECPEHWFPRTEREKRKSARKHKPIKLELGSKRWQALPEPYDDTFEAQKIVPPGYEPEHNRAGDPAAKKQVKQNNTLSQILHEWRAKWNLSGQYADATFDDIIKDMADIQPHVRLKAIATIGKAAEYKPPSDPGIQIVSSSSHDDEVSGVPERVFVALDCLLNDPTSEVRRAAAITLYALEHPTHKAQQILRDTLKSESSSERWAAAQCLAHFGVCDSEVVDEIIKQILASEEPIRHEQGIALLAKISNSTTLVHCMVAEQLNSSSWRYRVIACKILPSLYGNINKDVTQKLTELMWHDWHTEVRRAAAQCLGKTSHGRAVHDDIQRCIMYGNERTKLEAISRLGQLGIMTAKLLPAFLECFDDQYVSIRTECCITSGNLQIKDEQVLEKLVHLATFDPIWKVKALAIQALGKIGEVTDSVKECLMWAMRYEEKAGVRAEACHSLLQLGIMDEDVIQILQERLLVETSPVVRDEISEALQLVGLSETEDMDMVAQIKGEVRKLCKRNIIASQIVLNEADEIRQENLTNMIYQTEEELKEKEKEIKQAQTERLRSLASAGGQTSTQTPLSRASHTKDTTGEAPESGTTSPEQSSREGTLFTPSADKELEAILNREDEPSQPSGPSSAKSRPVTGETVTSGTYTSPDTVSRNSKPSLPEEYIQEMDRQLTSTTADGSLNLNLGLTPARSRLGVTPSASVLDMKGSALSLAQLSGRRTVISRETIREREKLQEHISAAYEGLTDRYSDMIEELVSVDRGLMFAPAGSSKFLTVPGEGAAPSTEPDQQQVEADCVESAASGYGSGETEDQSGNCNSNAVESGETEEDGQVAVSLEVPLSEITSENSNNKAELLEESDGESQVSTYYSTKYPSLVAEDIAQHLLEVESAADYLAPSQDGSTTYYTGAASDYGQSARSDGEESTTLD